MKQLFINIPVSDFEQAVPFYRALGFSIHPLFTDEEQIGLVWTDTIFVMLQTFSFSNSYLKKEAIDPRKHQMPSFTLPVESMEAVDEIIRLGIAAGGLEPVHAIENEYMYLRSIEDIDGYLWGILYLDQDKFQEQKSRG